MSSLIKFKEEWVSVCPVGFIVHPSLRIHRTPCLPYILSGVMLFSPTKTHINSSLFLQFIQIKTPGRFNFILASLYPPVKIQTVHRMTGCFERTSFFGHNFLKLQSGKGHGRVFALSPLLRTPCIFSNMSPFWRLTLVNNRDYLVDNTALGSLGPLCSWRRDCLVSHHPH